MENLLNLSSSNWEWINNNGEVSATYNSDNTITITSDDTGSWGLDITQPGLTLLAGKKYIFSCNNIGSNTWISINEDPNAMLKKNHGSIEYVPAEDITSPTIKIWVETTVYDNVTFNIKLAEVNTKYNTIRIKRGPSSSLESASLLEGELAVTTDTHDLYVGTSDGYVQLNSQPDIPTKTSQLINDNEYITSSILSSYVKIADVPIVYLGTTGPTSDIGKDGDIYIMTE